MTSIALSEFVKRQTPTSRFSHFEGSVFDLLSRTRDSFPDAAAGYRHGVLVVPIEETSGFFTGVCVLKDGDMLIGSYEPRRKGEDPRKSTCVIGAKKLPAKKVDVILYHRDVLCEDPTHESLAEWEIVSINCSPVEGEIPIEPNVLLHNHFGSTGGTATGMTDSELVDQLRKSFEWWKDKAFVREISE